MAIPQMAPMMWNLIFICSSIMLMITLTKTYFILNKKEIKGSMSSTASLSSNKTWLW